MMEITDLYDALQRVKVNTKAYEEWTQYRKQLTDVIISLGKAENNLAIYGAGRCDDIDIGRLCEHYKEVTLIDMDMRSMKEALDKYSLSESGKIKLRFMDFVGISQDSYIELAKKMQGALSDVSSNLHHCYPTEKLIEEIDRFFLGYEYKVTCDERYDIVVVASVHSQLNQRAPALWKAICELEDVDPYLYDQIADHIHDKTMRIVALFDQMVLTSAREAAVFAYETGIVGREEGIQGAMQLQDDLSWRQFRKQIEIAKTHRAIWPQNASNGIIFEMNIDEIRIK